MIPIRFDCVAEPLCSGWFQTSLRLGHLAGFYASLNRFTGPPGPSVDLFQFIPGYLVLTQKQLSSAGMSREIGLLRATPSKQPRRV